MYLSTYAAPAPSLCDSCRHAGVMGGGSVSIGPTTYRQRYCAVTHPGESGGRAIHTGGYQQCNEYEANNA